MQAPAPTPGLVFDLPPDGWPELAASLTARGARALSPGTCAVEVVERPDVLRVILSWRRAVPLRVERLAGAVVAAHGRLRRDLDAERVRGDASALGRPAVCLETAADVVAHHAAPTDGAVLGLAARPTAA